MAGTVPPGHGTGRPGAVHLPRIQPRLLSAAKRVDGGSFCSGHRRLQRRAWGNKEHCGVCEKEPGIHSIFLLKRKRFACVRLLACFLGHEMVR